MPYFLNPENLTTPATYFGYSNMVTNFALGVAIWFILVLLTYTTTQTIGKTRAVLVSGLVGLFASLLLVSGGLLGSQAYTYLSLAIIAISAYFVYNERQ